MSASPGISTGSAKSIPSLEAGEQALIRPCRERGVDQHVPHGLTATFFASELVRVCTSTPRNSRKRGRKDSSPSAECKKASSTLDAIQVQTKSLPTKKPIRT